MQFTSIVIIVLIQPAGLQIQQQLLARVLQQDYRPGAYTLKDLMRKAASCVKDMVIAGDLCAPITEMFAQHRWPGLTHVMMVGSGTIDADVVFHLGQFVPQSTRMLQRAQCHLAPGAFGSLSDECLSGLRFLNLSDCSLGVPAMHCLSKAVWSNLNVLDLSQNRLSDSAVKLLVSAKLLSLRLLHLPGTGLNAAALETLKCRKLALFITFVSSGEPHRYQGMQLLMQGAWPGLQYLGLTHDMLDEGVYALLELRYWQHLWAGIAVSHAHPPHRHIYAPKNDIALSRSTGRTWPSLDTVAVSFVTT